MRAKLSQLCLLVALAIPASTSAQPSSLARDDFWVPDGSVNAIAEINGVVYIGGLFNYISPVSETGKAFDLISGATLPSFPTFNGAIRTIVIDGSGGWFVGGLFTSVGGFPVTNLAHIRADKTVDTAWTPNPDGSVLALASSSVMLYVGGTFTNIGGQRHSLLAALDPATGSALQWRADVTTSFPKPSVNALVLSEDRLYLGGYFSFINDTLREHIGSVDAATGAVTPWYPNGYAGSESGVRVDAMAISGKTIFVGGTFSSIGGSQTNGPIRHYLAALDTTQDDLGASVLPWNPDADGPVTSLAVSCDTVYVGGSFTHIGGQQRNRIAALDLNTAAVKPWNPDADGDVLNVTLAGSVLYAGGKFTQIGGLPRPFLAALDINSGGATLWNPRADFGVAGLALSGGSVVAGGALGPGGKRRENVAAFDSRTGQPLDWNPQISGSTMINVFPYEGVYTLAASSNTIYLGGTFTNINGQLRNRLGAVDAVTGAVTPWNPNANGIVQALAACGNVVYAGGRFTSSGGQMRTNVAALDATTGLATAWNPKPNDKVTAIFCRGSTVYLGGLFTQLGTQVRKRLAAVDSNGSITSWNPNVNDQVSSISSLGDTLYIGGQFSMVGSANRSRLAAVDLTSGAATCWDPNPLFGAHFPAVNTVAASSNSVYVGGAFSTVAAQPRDNLAALSPNCPVTPASWNPNTDSSVNALASSGNTVFAGGVFQSVGGQYHPHFAVFPPVGSPVITVQPLTQLVPVGTSVVLQAQASGVAPLSYQWQLNGTNLPAATSSTLILANAQISDSGDYVLVVTNALGLVHSRPATLTVVDPIIILTQPASQTVAPGANVTLTVAVRGSPPPIYQWRLNGVNIPGAIYPTLTISNAQPKDGGSYSVVVANIGSAVNSSIASVQVTSPALGLADNLIAHPVITTASGVGSGSNLGASKEAGEPNHAGKPGGRSVWLGWRAPASGIATFSTRGSSFDTLLGIYTGNSFSNLVEIAADEDRGGFATSQASFNAAAGTEYLIAIDGFAGAAGQIVLSWDLDTTSTPFPRILNQPLSQSVFSGSPASFSVVVNSPTPVTYQWFHECGPIAGATNAMLTITNVRPADVGNYHVLVMNASSHAAESVDAFLEIGPQAKIISQDKLEDLFLNFGSAPSSNEIKGQGILGAADGSSGGFLLVSLGTINSQILNNTTATSSQNETNHCGVLGGASQWLGMHTAADGVMQVDTIGSAIDTVLAVYTGSSLLTIREVACDNNGAPDGIRSLLKFNAIHDTDYLLAVDGVNGAKGTISLNWRLGLAPRVTSCTSNAIVRQGGSFNFCAQVTSPTSDLSYQWRLNGQIIAGATNSTLALNNVQPAQAGAYSVIVRNFAGVVTNSIATITLALPIRLNVQIVRTNAVSIFRLTGPSGQGYVLQASTNLSCGPCWLSLYTNSSASAPLDFLDWRSTNYSRRFYRVVPWP